MTTIVGRNTKVEVALTFGTAKTLTAITKAMPGKATCAAHGLADGTVGYLSIAAGMVEADLQAVRVDNPTTNDFDLQGLDTTGYSTFSAGTLTPALTWGTLTESAGYEIGGGAANLLDDTRLTDSKQRNVNGLLAAQNITINVKNQTVNGSVMDFVESAAKTQTNCLFRITLQDGAVRFFYGTPSLPGESVSVGALASGSFQVTVPAWVLKGAA